MRASDATGRPAGGGFERGCHDVGGGLATARAGTRIRRAFDFVQPSSLMRPADRAPAGNAARLEQEFHALTHAGGVRLGYGTQHVAFAEGVDARRRYLGIHPHDILEAMEHAAPSEHAGQSPYGALVRITGVTGTGRAIIITAQADRLPMMVVSLEADL